MKVTRFNELYGAQPSPTKKVSSNDCWVIVFMDDRVLSEIMVFDKEEDSDNYLINYVNGHIKENGGDEEFDNAQEAEDWWDNNCPDGATIYYRKELISSKKISSWQQLKNQEKFDL